MSSVRLVGVLLLVVLVLGCLGSGQTKKDEREPDVLIDAAKAKVAVADQYILEEEEDKAVDALADAKEDLEGALPILNATLADEEANGIRKAVSDIEAALDSLRNGDAMAAQSYLKMAEEELLTVSVLLLGSSEMISPSRFTVEMKELPLTYYGYVDGIYLGHQVVPHNVAAAARKAFYSYQENKDEKALERGLFLTEYLISTSTMRGDNDFVVWENNFVWPPYNLSKGWIGALSQAGCIKALMLAYDATGGEKYKEFADMAVTAFEVDVSEGGLMVTRKDTTGAYMWYPEYARPDPPYVLNGFITSVVWLGEYYTATGDEKAKALYEEGLKSIQHFLPAYEYNAGWSYYDAVSNKADSHYHELHIKQMATLYELTGDEIFKEYQERWSSGVAEQ
ncbi:MAG: D-glucuronyl C5-epimerase family protein [Candidatus Hydrothermarchaeales archaeon]